MPDIEPRPISPADAGANVDTSPAGGEEVPDWLKELSLEDVTPEAPAEVPVEAPVEEVSGWLSGLMPADVQPGAAPISAPLAEADVAVSEPQPEVAVPASEPETPAGEPVLQPITFLARGNAVRRLAAAAANEAGLLPEKIAGELKFGDELRKTPGETGLRVQEMTPRELETLREARDILSKSMAFAGREDLIPIDNAIALQEQYRLGAEMAADVEESMRAAAKELKPGWFKKEPAVVREMAELQEFFDRIVNVEKLNLTKAEIEAEKATKMWQNGAVKENYKKDREAELKRVETELAMLESAEKFMARADIPKTLREVIAAGRVGRESLFGAGPVDNFRRRVYESIIETLGVEADPALEAVEATPSPEPEPILPPESMVAPPEVVAVEVAAPLVPEEEAAPVLVEAPEAEEVSAPVETPEQRVERRKQGFAGALAELDRARNDTSGTEGEQRIRFAEAYNQAIGAAMEFMEEGDVARETVKGFLAGALGIPNGSQLMEIVVGDRLDQAGVTGAPAGEKKKKLEKAGLLGLLELLLELGMSFTDKSIGAVVAEVQTATGAGR